MPKDDRTYPCGECSEVLSRDHDLERHRLAKHASEIEKIMLSYYCRCGARSIQKTNIAGHIRSAHTGETIHCGSCTFEATSDATLTRHRQETGHESVPRRRKARAKKSSTNSPSSSPAPEIRTVTDFISFYGNTPLTYSEFTLYQNLVHNAQGHAPPTPPSTPATSPSANLTVAPLSMMSTSSTPVLAPLVLAATVPEVPSPVMARTATPTPSPECFLAIPEEARLPPIGVYYRDYHSTAPLTACVLQPKISSQPSRYHRYGPY
ncbi:hypothetical protein IW261DRAFT_1506155 [Armillaria novae-zelandiae]|uniref:C2H2-type domain-containing protein n=1 Tax=Armillaria novae-zelandiae TaxID=153914 RepID=A0AA39NW68_9AGAR|nr:hypothetical protein IW261DRAFT_1506155 [Armillaria novae-zelandiae]